MESTVRDRRKLRDAERTIKLLLFVILALVVAIIAMAVTTAKSPESGAAANPAIVVPLAERVEPWLGAVEAEPEPEYSWADVETLARLVYWEAGSADITDRHQQLVAQVVLNRVASPLYADTIAGVIAQPGQYSVARLVQAGKPETIPTRCLENAICALNGSVDCPGDVIYQSEFKQGIVYEVHTTSYSTTYFCSGGGVVNYPTAKAGGLQL